VVALLSSSIARRSFRRATPSLLGVVAFLSACESVTEPEARKTPKGGVVDTPTVTQPVTTTPTAPTTSGTSVLVGSKLWVDPYSSAAKTADAWRTTRPADATQMDKIAAQSQAIWIGNWNTNVATDVSNFTTKVAAAGAVPVFVAYNIPQRDCGGLSGGNLTIASQYRTWIDGFAAGIGTRRAVVILEPDALAAMGCLSSTDQQTRISLISYAIGKFKALGSTSVYVDAGHPRWMSTTTMATRLQQAGIANADGFSLNISNFIADSENITYGQTLSALVGNKHFIIDSGRNGLGPTADMQWCNPAGRALGTRPTTVTGVAGLDAFLWIKKPGESDGACNGAPSAGTWMPEYALGLAQRAAY
jgi:endoglucanase